MDDQPRLDEAGEYKAGEHKAGEHKAGENEAGQGDVVFTPRELEMIAEAEDSLARGFYVDGEEVQAWLASLGSAHELPVPPVRQRG